MSHVCSRDVLSCQNMELDKHKYDLLLTIKELEKMGVKSCAQRIILMLLCAVHAFPYCLQ